VCRSMPHTSPLVQRPSVCRCCVFSAPDELIVGFFCDWVNQATAKGEVPYALRRLLCAWSGTNRKRQMSGSPMGGVPLCGCQGHFRGRRAVKGPVAQHGEQHVASASCERNEGLVMALSLADLACVVRPGERITQSCKGRQEHRTLQLFVSASRRQFTTDGRARAPCDRRKPSVGGQMCRRREGAARHIDQEVSQRS
jgi:hypothetical protein